MTRWTDDDVQRHEERRRHSRTAIGDGGFNPSITERRSKYRNVKTVVDGITFDSKKEAQRYHELTLMEKAGAITDLRRQVRFPLACPGPGMSSIDIATYVADFVYRERGVLVVEDVKGVKTAMYRLKKKWLRMQKAIEIREI